METHALIHFHGDREDCIDKTRRLHSNPVFFLELCLCVSTVHLRNQFTNNGISFGVLLSNSSSAKNFLMNLLTAY